MKKSLLISFCTLLCVIPLHAATIDVNPGSGTIKAAVNVANAGDTLVLTNGTYNESSSISPAVALTIQAAAGTQPVIKLSSRMEIKADFTLQGVTIQTTSDVLRIVTGDALFNLTIDNCLFLLGNTANTARTIYAGEVPQQLRNVSITNCTFDGGKGTGRFIYLYGGSSLTAIAGTAIIDHCTFYNSTDTRGVYPANLDNIQITNCIFMNPAERENTNSFAVYGSNSYVHNCLAFNAPVKVGTGGSQANCITRNPYFVEPNNGNFQLYKNSPAINAGTDNTTLGDPRWGVSSENYDNSHDPYIPYKQPYSMAPTTNSVKILWQMNDETEATNAVVYYGTDPDNLDQQISTSSGWNVADEGYMHIVTLTGLQPNTRYYFTVGASAKRRFDKICSTKTAPEQGTAFRIFTISDIHGNARNNWSNMQDFICSLNCDISLMNGDFVSSKGNDRNWNNYFFTPGAQFLSQVPLMSSVGNHETGDPRGIRWSSYYDYFHQFPHEGACEGDTIDPRNEAYFHFVYGNADIIMLNLNGDESSPAFLPGSRQYAWADSILNMCTQPWIIICHHVGVHTSGYHGQWADEPRQMGKLFEKYAAEPYNKRIISLSGDDHSFEHLYKKGVHYLRPGCGRDANYDQQKQLADCRYSMFYRRVSCFSTLDMSADASTITLTAYDSIGTPFYSYTFLHEGEVIDIPKDTIAPPAPTNLTGHFENGTYRLTWSNPTHLVHVDELLTDFSNGIGNMITVNDDGAAMDIQVTDGVLQCNYAIYTAWATASVDYPFNAVEERQSPPFLSFRLKGNGSATDLRIVCKNIYDDHEDWWYTESINLASTEWQTITLDLRTLQAFDWYTNTADSNRCEGLVDISFGVSTSDVVSGTFYLDDIRVSGYIYPAPDYAQTVIVRKEDTFPSSPTDGLEIYRGTAETCVDSSIAARQVYYYAAFAADKKSNWSTPDSGAQWEAKNTSEAIENIEGTSAPQKFLLNGHLYIRHASGTYTIIGQTTKW